MNINPTAWILRRFGYESPSDDATERIARSLGLDPAKLKQELRESPSLEGIAEDQDVPLETLKASLTEVLVQKIELGVEQDQLTRPEADELRQKTAALIDDIGHPNRQKFSWRSVPIFGIVFVVAIIVRLLSK